MIKHNLIVFLLIILLYACHPASQEYYRYQLIESGIWKSPRLVTIGLDSFSVNPQKAYAVSLEITHNNQYRYNDIWLLVDFFNLSDSLHDRRKMHILLADSLHRWRGSGVGGLHQLSVAYKDALLLDSGKRYQIEIRQLMYDNPLIGIEKIGVKVE